MKYITNPFIAFISLFGVHTTSAQLAVISDQNIDFSNTVSTISDGSWGHSAIYLTGLWADALGDVNDIDASQISIYPNPATEYFYIEGPHPTVDVSIYSLDGKHINTFKHTTQSPIQT